MGLMGQLVFFSTFAHLIQLTCFTVHSNLLRINSNIYRNILPIFVADMSIFQEANKSGKVQEKQDLFVKVLCFHECQKHDAICIFLKSIQ